MFKPFEELKLSDDYMFAKAMRNKSLCKELLEIILDVEIEDIVYPEEQKVIDYKADAKSVRLDVYVKDTKHTVYNIEMQTTSPKNLPKRSRYYQSMIDINLISKGESYDELNKSFIIFICMSDISHKGRHIYTFENVCLQDKDISLQDEAVKIFLNPYGTKGDVSDRLKNFLLYLSDGMVSDTFTEALDAEVAEVRENKEWRRDYMTLEMRYKEKFDEGLAKGIEQGINELVLRMLSKGKTPEQVSELCDIPLNEVLAVKDN